MTRESDPALRRIERNSAIACCVLVVVAWSASGRVAPAVGVLAGGGLAALSYWVIKTGADRFAAPTGAPRAPMAWSVLKIVVRYALLAGIAYVMIARLRLHPLGLVAGVSAVVVGVAAEGLRTVFGRPSGS